MQNCTFQRISIKDLDYGLKIDGEWEMCQLHPQECFTMTISDDEWTQCYVWPAYPILSDPEDDINAAWPPYKKEKNAESI